MLAPASSAALQPLATTHAVYIKYAQINTNRLLELIRPGKPSPGDSHALSGYMQAQMATNHKPQTTHTKPFPSIQYTPAVMHAELQQTACCWESQPPVTTPHTLPATPTPPEPCLGWRALLHPQDHPSLSARSTAKPAWNSRQQSPCTKQCCRYPALKHPPGVAAAAAAAAGRDKPSFCALALRAHPPPHLPLPPATLSCPLSEAAPLTPCALPSCAPCCRQKQRQQRWLLMRYRPQPRLLLQHRCCCRQSGGSLGVSRRLQTGGRAEA